MPKDKFIEPSASGPTQKLVHNKDGTTHVIPGKAHEAQEGRVLNPGVRTISTGGAGPQCPLCKRVDTLKMHMNKPAGERIYCSADDCNYDTSKPGNTDSSKRTRVVSSRGVNTERGVTILRGSR